VSAAVDEPDHGIETACDAPQERIGGRQRKKREVRTAKPAFRRATSSIHRRRWASATRGNSALGLLLSEELFSSHSACVHGMQHDGSGAQPRRTGRWRSLRHPRWMSVGYQTASGPRCATTAAASS
jgi:hypothetical protein